MRPRFITSTGKEELPIFVILLVFIHFCYHVYIFELPPFVVFLIKLYLVSKCFSHFHLNLVLPGTGNSLGGESVTGCMSAYLSARS